MRKKISMLVMFCLTFIFVLTGCGQTTGSRFCATEENIYDFYVNNLCSNQGRISSRVYLGNYENSDDNFRCEKVMNYFLVNEEIEAVLISAVACFNSTESPKSVVFEFGDDARITVNQSAPTYNASVVYLNQTNEYKNIAVTKNGTKYTVKYSYITAIIDFDQERSYLAINLKTLNELGKNLVVQKECIQYSGGDIVSNYCVSENVTSGYARYSISSYATTFVLNFKIAKLNAEKEVLGLVEVTAEDILKLSQQDQAGYVFLYDQSGTQTKSTINVLQTVAEWDD